MYVYFLDCEEGIQKNSCLYFCPELIHGRLARRLNGINYSVLATLLSFSVP